MMLVEKSLEYGVGSKGISFRNHLEGFVERNKSNFAAEVGLLTTFSTMLSTFTFMETCE